MGKDLHGSEPVQPISYIAVEELFGLYTYRLPEQGSFANAAILYGDNGVGKSTILRLTFHLLSAANDRGHRSALFEAPFKTLEVGLASGAVLRACRTDKLTGGTLELTIQKGSERRAEWLFLPGHKEPSDEIQFPEFEIDKDGKVQIIGSIKSRPKGAVPTGEEAYLSELRALVPRLFMLNSDRRLSSDTLPDPSEDIELRNLARFPASKKFLDLVTRSRETALAQAMENAATWVRNKALQGANQGSMNVHGVYVDVLRRLITSPASKSEALQILDTKELIEELRLIETRTRDLARYEFATPLMTTEFQKALETKNDEKRSLAAELLDPYVKSLESRLRAVDPIYSLTDRFIEVINSFLRDKQLSFTASKGFVITNKLGQTLLPSALSSGEQQLLLMFSFVLAGREKPSVFIIDEPEISLNVKWQRQLVRSLLDITSGTEIQFIFASHSLELLSQHKSRVVQLVSTQ